MADANFRVKNTLVVNNSFVANSTVVNAAAITATSLTVGANVTVNATAVFVGNSSVNTVTTAGQISISGVSVNSTIYGGTANNANNLGGISLATLQGQITGNAATAYSNAVSNFAVSNAASFYTNATNITTGTLPDARLSSAIVNTSAAFTIAGVHTHSANIAMGGATITFTSGSVNSTAFTTGSNTVTIGTAAYFVSNGNVGIGTSSPAYKLDVTGQGRATTGFAVSTDGSTFTPSGLNAIPNYGMGYITSTSQTIISGFGGIPFYTNQAERMRIDTNGNVGIGTSSPGVTLDVNGAITGRAVGAEGGQINLNNPNNLSTGLIIDVSIADTGRIYSVSSNSALQMGQLAGTGGSVAFYTAATERLQISSLGQFGIGGANYGTPGQVLTSGGPASAPSWQAASSTGALKNVQVFTSSGTYTRTSGVTTAVVFAVGGGGGGSGGLSTAGGSGGTTSFGSHVTAAGGSGGGTNMFPGAGGTGGTGATISIKGNPGSTPTAAPCCIGVGGSGGGQGGGISGAVGVRGGGGSGRSNLGNQGSGGGQGETSIKYTATVGATETVTIGGAGTSSGGTAGGPGYIIVYEYS